MTCEVRQMRRRYRFDDCLGTGQGEARWQYVEVEASVQPSGFTVPRVLVWPDGRRFAIDSILLCRHRDFDQGWYYEVSISGQVKQLWYRHGAFFVLVQQGGTKNGGEPPAPDLYELRKRYGYRA